MSASKEDVPEKWVFSINVKYRSVYDSHDGYCSDAGEITTNTEIGERSFEDNTFTQDFIKNNEYFEPDGSISDEGMYFLGEQIIPDYRCSGSGYCGSKTNITIISAKIVREKKENLRLLWLDNIKNSSTKKVSNKVKIPTGYMRRPVESAMSTPSESYVAQPETAVRKRKDCMFKSCPWMCRFYQRGICVFEH